MKKSRLVIAASVVVAVLVASALGYTFLNRKMVTVYDGELVLCTYGEIVSDTTEQLEVSANKVGDYGVKTRTITCDLHTKLADLYATAQTALAADDPEAAKKALTEVLKLDPTYGKARSQLTDLEAGKTSVVDTGAPADAPDSTPPTGETAAPSETPGEEAPTGPSVNLAVYMPDRVGGFVGQLLIVDPFVLTRDYLPETPGKITKLVIVAQQFKDVAAAQAALGNLKHAYPASPAGLEVGGKPAYFGAKQTVSAVAFIDGAILVVVEAGATEGDGAAFKSTVVGIAEEIVP